MAAYLITSLLVLIVTLAQAVELTFELPDKEEHAQVKNWLRKQNILKNERNNYFKFAFSVFL